MTPAERLAESIINGNITDAFTEMNLDDPEALETVALVFDVIGALSVREWGGPGDVARRLAQASTRMRRLINNRRN